MVQLFRPSARFATSRLQALPNISGGVELQAAAGDPAEAVGLSDLLVSPATADEVRRMRPPVAGCSSAAACPPLPIEITLTLSDIFDIDEPSGTFRVQGQVVMQWHDLRLRMPSGMDRVQLGNDDAWTPQIDFYNQVGSLSTPATKLALLGVPGHARLTQTIRFVGTFAMRMNFVYCASDRLLGPPSQPSGPACTPARKRAPTAAAAPVRAQTRAISTRCRLSLSSSATPRASSTSRRPTCT